MTDGLGDAAPDGPHDGPLSERDVLRAEYRVLRPDGAPPAMGSPAAGAPLSGLCISGGGIRSATFGLGAIQGLAEAGLLPQFDYLSTVSGGGYIGSWLTAWATRAGGVEAVVPRLLHDGPSKTPDGAPDPVQNLRDYNRYLSPRAGALSSDLWTLVATILRNIVLNWLVLVPLVLLVLMAPRLYLSVLATPDRMFPAVIDVAAPDYSDPGLNRISSDPLVKYVLPIVSLALYAIVLLNTLRYLPGLGGRHHTREDYLLRIQAPLVGTVLTFLLFDSLHFVGTSYRDFTHVWYVIGWITLPSLGAVLLFAIFDRHPAGQRFGLLFGPLLVAVLASAAGIGVATWVTTNYVLWSPNAAAAPSWSEYVTVGPPLILLGDALGTVLFTGLSSRFSKDEDREWMSRAVAGSLVSCAVWLCVCLVVLILPEAVLAWRAWGHGAVVAMGAGSAWVTSVGPSLLPKDGSKTSSSAGVSVLRAIVVAAPLVFVVMLGVGLSLLTNMALAAMNGVSWTDHDAVLRRSSPLSLVGLAAVFLALSWVMSRYVNINTFSLHAMYRDRLVRAYVGASNGARKPNPFTGFDPNDDLKVTRLAVTRPFHIVNLTLNLVESSRLAWQQRKAAAFTVTPLHCGSATLGYRDASRYAGGMSLGTAVAISGAAASPNMGSLSTPLVTFILTLFNVRLGAWLGNPGAAGARSWTEAGPRSAIRLLVREALGLTSDGSPYVYLSDGGHFENLALYELIRRRCGLIVVLDGGCDPDFGFDDLGNALRKIRIDFGVSVDFDAEQWELLFARKRRSAVATIRYSSRDAGAPDGKLLYIKPVLLGSEPPDVRSYAVQQPAFPHQSTANQWFDESQTESYRQLGLHTLREVCAGWPKDRPLGDLFTHLAPAPGESGA